GKPISDCGAESVPMKRQKASVMSSISPVAFSIITAIDEASAIAKRRAAKRFSVVSVLRWASMSWSDTTTSTGALARIERGSEAHFHPVRLLARDLRLEGARGALALGHA